MSSREEGVEKRKIRIGRPLFHENRILKFSYYWKTNFKTLVEPVQVLRCVWMGPRLKEKHFDTAKNLRNQTEV